MKRQQLLLLLLLALPMDMLAENISKEQAQQIAMQFWASGTTDGARRAAAQMQLSYTSEGGELYVFNKADGDGWVIVAGDDGARSTILAYSDKGTFDYDKAPEAAKNLLQRYVDNITQLRLSGKKIAKARAPRRAQIVVAPLLKTHWGQAAPYNDLCPIDKYYSTNKCPTGCVATAVAQVMNYWQWPKRGTAQHTNTSATGETRNFAESVYDWDNMADTYTEGNYTEAQGRAVAQLMADVGTASDMAYTYKESGANMGDACHALFKYFGYKYEVQLYNAYAGKTRDVVLREELDAHRPVVAAIYDRLDFTWVHAIVIDGYDNEGYFHFNFGWDGQNDGYYDGPTETRYYSDELIYNIQPASHVGVYKDNVIYCITENDEAVACGTEDATVNIVESVEQDGQTFPVTQIFDQGFKGSQVINEVNIPGCIKEIPELAFYGCFNLQKVTLNPGVIRIGDRAFEYCIKLVDVSLGNGIEHIGNRAFRDCNKLTKIQIPESIKYFGDESFLDCDLEYFSIWSTDYIIGSRAFAHNSRLTYVGGLENAAEIRGGAFTDLRGDFTVQPTCKYATGAITGKFNHIYIGADVHDFNVNSVTGTAAYVVDADNPNYRSVGGLLFNKKLSKLLKCPPYEKHGESLNDRTHVKVPAGTKAIEKGAFSRTITNLTIPASVTRLDSTGCINFKNVTCLSPTPPVIHDEAISYYQNTVLNVPYGTKSAYQNAPGWSTFTTIKDQNIFIMGKYCYQLDSIYNPETNRYNCEGTLIARNATAEFDGNATDIAKEVTFDNKVYPVRSIGYQAFFGDAHLKHIVIPDLVTYMDEHALENCPNLETITIGKSLTDLLFDKWQWYYNPFDGCDRLWAINVAGGNEAFFSIDGILCDYDRYNDNARRLRLCPPVERKGDKLVTRSLVVIPSSLQEIANDAFGDYLQYVVIPASITNISSEISRSAFLACKNLKRVTNLATTPQEIGYVFDSSIHSNWLHTPAVLQVPTGTKPLYENQYGWRDFVEIVEINPNNYNPGPDNSEELDEPDNLDDLDDPDDPDNPDEPEVQEGVAVHRANGQVEYFSFAGHPIVTYEGDNLVMSCGNTRVLYTLKGLEKITFGSFTTSIDDSLISEGLSFHFDNDQIQIANAKAGEVIRVYNAAGRLVHLLHADGDGRLTIPLDTLPAGVYVIQLSKTIYKVLKQ